MKVIHRVFVQTRNSMAKKQVASRVSLAEALLPYSLEDGDLIVIQHNEDDETTRRTWVYSAANMHAGKTKIHATLVDPTDEQQLEVCEFDTESLVAVFRHSTEGTALLEVQPKGSTDKSGSVNIDGILKKHGVARDGLCSEGEAYLEVVKALNSQATLQRNALKTILKALADDELDAELNWLIGD